MSDLPSNISSEKTTSSDEVKHYELKKEEEEVLESPTQSEFDENLSEENKESETSKTETDQDDALVNSLNDSLKISNKRVKKLETLDIEGLSKYLLTCKNIVFMNGAGISTSAGIPDFRSPVTGLYANLSKYDLPFPEAVFCLDYFMKNPQPFYTLSKELMPKSYKPTPSHLFQKILIDKGHVLKVYTQNIDALETIAKIPEEKVIAAHGSFEKGHCISCKDEYNFDWMKEKLESEEYLKCENLDCLNSELDNSLKIVKPDITFFGEDLPQLFMKSYAQDFENCDLLIVMGTSLKVQPFGLLSQLVDDDCPRVLINRDLVGDFVESICDENENYRDIFIEGECDEVCINLAQKLGYYDELSALINNNLIDNED